MLDWTGTRARKSSPRCGRGCVLSATRRKVRNQVVFSLFNRKERNDSRRAREAQLARGADSRPGPTPDTLAAQREAARRTEEKIDRIESEMIAAAALARAGGAASAPVAPPVAPGVAPANPGTNRSGDERDARPSGPATAMLGDRAGAMAIDVNASSLPGVIEEAAILYSNGQPQPAAAALRQAIGDTALGQHQPLAWLMLLDLHQALGDRAAFEALALDYAARFESSPPGWNERLASAAGAPRASAAGGAVAIAFPEVLDASIAPQAESVVSATARRRETVVDFARAGSVDAAGAEALARMLRHCEKTGHALRVRGAEALYEAARIAIEPGRRDPTEACWMLAMQMLRILERQQAFEDLAIEYCVTYEVSPPSWEPPAASIRAAEAAAPARAQATERGAEPAPDAIAPDAIELRGEVQGRMQAELEAMRALAARGGEVVVDCRALRRMDFVAAGDLLNELVTMRAAGKRVVFVEPNYLVHALMLVMGIHDLAEIRRRKI